MKILLAAIILAMVSTFALAQSSQPEINLRFKISGSNQASNSQSAINPLILLIEIDESGILKLNSQSAGQIGSPAPLINRLKKVVEQRIKAGVFREGTNEPETDAKLRIDRAVNYRDAVNLIGKLRETGIQPLTLAASKSEFPVFFSDSAAEKNTLIIEISETGEYFIDGQKVEAKSLRQKVKGNDESILVKSSPNIKFGNIEDLLNAVKTN